MCIQSKTGSSVCVKCLGLACVRSAVSLGNGRDKSIFSDRLSILIIFQDSFKRKYTICLVRLSMGGGCGCKDNFYD